MAEDVADCIAWTVTRPHHVNIDLMVVRPLAQAAQHKVAARTSEPPGAFSAPEALTADGGRLRDEGDAELLARTAATTRSANASSSAAVAPGSVVSARLCRDDVPTLPSRVPLAEAGVLDQPGGAELDLRRRRPASSGSPRPPRSAGTIGLVKKLPALRLSGSAGSSTMPLPRRSAITASRTSRQRSAVADLDAQPAGQLGVAHRPATARPRRSAKRHVEDDEAARARA